MFLLLKIQKLPCRCVFVYNWVGQRKAESCGQRWWKCPALALSLHVHLLLVSVFFGWSLVTKFKKVKDARPLQTWWHWSAITNSMGMIDSDSINNMKLEDWYSTMQRETVQLWPWMLTMKVKVNYVPQGLVYCREVCRQSIKKLWVI